MAKVMPLYWWLASDNARCTQVNLPAQVSLLVPYKYRNSHRQFRYLAQLGMFLRFI